ncbi:protein wech-like [Mercenaria mercenaria]|uniref:protein wech-like n=1 Tax=Mercenaria mercenaria TaxID=6596 RepID=UPI00234ED272|nr:protein wech-like [Mercenaria mercenaria]
MEVGGRREPNKFIQKQEDILCQPCQCDGVDILADGYCKTCNEYFCSFCLKLHKRLSISKAHVIIHKDRMPKVPYNSDPCLELCTIHKAEIVKSYCQRHDSVGCNDCMIVDHTSCKIQLVTEVSSNYGNSRELNLIKQRIADLTDNIVSSKHEITCTLKRAQEMKNKLTEEIKTFRKELNDYFDRMEAKLLDEVEQITARDVALQTQLKDQCKTMEKEIEEFQSKLDQHSAKSNQLFVTTKLAQKRLHTYQKAIENIAFKPSINVYKFKPSTDLTALKENQTPIGILSSQNPEKTEQSSDYVSDMTTQFVRKFSVRTETENDCWITGMAMISNDEILLADCLNRSLKILNVTETSITSMIMPPGKPLDVTTINSETAAATLTDTGKILFVDTKNGLSTNNILTVRKNCKGIDYHDGHLVVSFCGSPPAVQILNMNGHILHEISDTHIFQHPCNVAFSKDKKTVFVSDFKKNTVNELEIDGNLNVLVKHENLNRPSGLAMTKSGSVVVCCVGDSDRVSMIDTSTTEVLPLYTQHVEKPESILVREDLNCMYICENRGTVDSNYIKMYYLTQ